MKRQHGFTLIEALVALAILAFGLMGIAAMQLNALHSATRGYQHSVATLAAVDAQERLWARLGEIPEDDEKDCNDIDLSSVRSSWQMHWGSDSPSNPLRHANLDIQPDNSSACAYEITLALDDAEADDDGYGEVSYTMRLPQR